MRRALIAFSAALLYSAAASAHALWLEPDEGGARLYYGEFDENLREASPGLLDRLAMPTAKVATADGKALKVEKGANWFKLSGDVTSKESVVAEQVRVSERKQGDKVTRTFGSLGARYVPDLSERAAMMTLDVVPAGKPGGFKVFYQGKPLAKVKLELIAELGWKREFKTEADGTIEVALPWKGAYVIEVEHLDATAGAHEGAAYDSKRYVATLFFRVPDGLQGPPQPAVVIPKREMK